MIRVQVRVRVRLKVRIRVRLLAKRSEFGLGWRDEREEGQGKNAGGVGGSEGSGAA